MNRLRSRLLLLLFPLLLLSGPASAMMLFEANLDGSQETPANGSPGTGFSTVTLNDAQDQIMVTLLWQDLVAGATAAHIHHAPVGVPGPVIIPLDLGGNVGMTSGSLDPSPQTFALTAEELGWLLNGELYVNVHSPEYPAGEIRGQLLAAPVPEPSAGILLALGMIAAGSVFFLRRRPRAVAAD